MTTDDQQATEYNAFKGTLCIDAPFNLGLTLGYDQGHRWRPDSESPGWYTSVLGRDFVRVRQKTKDGPLDYESSGQEIASKLLCQFRVDDNIEAVYGTLAADSRMKALVDRYCGLRIMRVDPWECLVFFILSAHNHSQSHVATAPTANAIDEIARWFWEDGRSETWQIPIPDARHCRVAKWPIQTQRTLVHKSDWTRPERHIASTLRWLEGYAGAHSRGSAVCRGWRSGRTQGQAN